MKIGLFGAGDFGNALYSLYSKIYNTTLYSRRASILNGNENLHIIASVDYLFLTVPAKDIKDVCAVLRSILHTPTNIIVCAKGIDSYEGKLLYELAQEQCPNNAVLVMSGPNFAYEITRALPAITSIAASSFEIAKVVSLELSNPFLKFYPTEDLVGVSLAGALKNVLAIICGIIRGLELGENFMAAAVNHGVREIFHIVSAKGGSASTIFEPACIGDIFLTCSSLNSRNIKYGMSLIARHEALEDMGTVEGVETAISLNKHYQHFEIPLLKYAGEVILNKTLDKNNVMQTLKNIIINA